MSICDGEVLARSAELQLMFRNRGFDYSPQRLKIGSEQAERAVRLVPESPEAVMALSLAQRYTGNAAGEVESLRRVLKLTPNHARALLMLGSHLTFGGQEAEGLEMYRKASAEAQWAPLANYFADLAVPMLEKLIDADANWPLTTILLKQDPLWDKIRDDPGFQKLLTSAPPKVPPSPAL